MVLTAFGIFCKTRLPTSEVDNFSLKMSWNILKYTGTIYSTRSLQIRGVFEVKVIHFRVGGGNSHTCCGESVRIRKTEISERIWNFWIKCYCSVTVCTTYAKIYHFHFKNSPDLKRSRRVDGPSIFWFSQTRKIRDFVAFRVTWFLINYLE